MKCTAKSVSFVKKVLFLILELAITRKFVTKLTVNYSERSWLNSIGSEKILITSKDAIPNSRSKSWPTRNDKLNPGQQLALVYKTS